MKSLWIRMLVGLGLLMIAAPGALAQLSMDEEPTSVPDTSNVSMLAPDVPKLVYDDGIMDDRRTVNLSGITVEFAAPEGQDVTAVQFYGARYAIDVTPNDKFTITVSDADFKPVRRIDKPLANISPGREVWQSVAIAPPVKVQGRFFVTLTFNSTRDQGIYIGLDDTSASGFSKVGVPPTLPTDVEAPFNWMLRARTAKPGQSVAAAIKPSVAPKPVSGKPGVTIVEAKKPPVKTTVATGTKAGQTPKVTKPAPTVVVKKPAAVVKTAASPKPTAGKISGVSHTGGAAKIVKPMPPAAGKLAYRDPYRRLSFLRSAPRIPRGSGRVDVTWDTVPVTIELNYVGKPAKIIENLDVKRLVVDFPVPEPGLFNVVVHKQGNAPASKQFRVVSGSRQTWLAKLQPGNDIPSSPAITAPETPKPADTGFPKINLDTTPGVGMEPAKPVIEEPGAPTPGSAPSDNLSNPPTAPGEAPARPAFTPGSNNPGSRNRSRMSPPPSPGTSPDSSGQPNGNTFARPRRDRRSPEPLPGTVPNLGEASEKDEAQPEFPQPSNDDDLTIEEHTTPGAP